MERVINMGTATDTAGRHDAAIWEQLLRLAEEGDIRAIKLYYEILEKRGGAVSSACGELTAIRCQVFGSDTVAQDARAAADWATEHGMMTDNGEDAANDTNSIQIQ